MSGIMCLLSGNRGWHLEIWNSEKMQNVNEVDNIATLNETLDGYNVSYIDDAKYDYDGQKHVARVSGYFVAPDSGNFTFYIKGEHIAKMYLTAQHTRVSTDCGDRVVIGFIM